MHEYPLLEILAVGFTMALIFGYLAKRIGLSPIVGYLLAGFLVGPYTPGFAADMTLAMELAEAGVILLMFGVGLHFHLDDLLAVKGISLPGALFQSTVATLCGVVVAELCGLSLASGLMMGMGIAVASTVVLLRVLTDNQMLDTIHGHVAVGWLVVEDVLTIMVLVLLPSIAIMLAVPEGGETAGVGIMSIFKAAGLAAVRLALLWVLVFIIGGRVVPWLLTHVVRTRSQELFTLTILVAAFATAVGSAVFFHASVALGAFLGGMVVGKTKLAHQAGADLLPLRDAFAVLFFISVGMMLDPAFIIKEPLLICLALVIVLFVKPMTAIFIVTLLGYSMRTALVVGIALAQVGEFSFILAQQANKLKLIEMDVYNVLVVCAIISITLNPGLFRTIPSIEKFLQKRKKLWDFLNGRANRRADLAAKEKLEPAPQHEEELSSHVIVVGYGPAGKTVVGGLAENGIISCIIDMNVDTVNTLNREGLPAIYGDSTREDILAAAGIQRARALVVTIPDLENTAATATIARKLNPEIRVLVRARFLNDKPLLERTGVNGIIFEEEEVAHTLTQLVLDDLNSCDEGFCPMYRELDAKILEKAAQMGRTNLSEKTL